MKTATKKTQKKSIAVLADEEQSATRAVLANPFKAGDTVVIPAGTIFTSSAPTLKGRQKVKRAHKVVVSETVPAQLQPRHSEKGSKVLVRPLRIRAKASGGYWKDIPLNEKIVKFNGKTPTYETLAL
jgi:hypothetical protein